MNIGSFARPFGYSLVTVLVLMGGWTAHARAQDHAEHTARSTHGSPDQVRRASALVALVRDATERFRDVDVADAEDYKLMFGCVSGSDYGAMGLHYVNLSLVGDGVLDPAHPEIVIYEPLPNGRQRLIGADYLVFASDWHKKNPDTTPQILGQLLHLFESPNRYGLPAFYTLHVWAWKENPNGAFVNWHPNVSCESFNPEP